MIGPCPYRQVLTMDSDDRLKCTLSLCSARPPSTSYPINEAVYYSRKSLNKKESSSSYEYNNNHASGLTKGLTVPTYHSAYPSTPKQLVPTKDGKCLQLGSSSHCSCECNDDSQQLLAFDILEKELECHDISDPWSPYYSSEEENQLIDSVYNSIQHENKVAYGEDKKKKTRYYRQSSGQAINIPNNPPCRPGKGQGKCIDKLM